MSQENITNSVEKREDGQEKQEAVNSLVENSVQIGGMLSKLEPFKVSHLVLITIMVNTQLIMDGLILNMITKCRLSS